MFDLNAFATALLSLVKRSPIFFVLFLLVVVVFLAAPFLWVYRKARAVIPGAAALPAK